MSFARGDQNIRDYNAYMRYGPVRRAFNRAAVFFSVLISKMVVLGLFAACAALFYWGGKGIFW